MEWTTRQYFDREARQKLRDTLPDAEILAMAEKAYEDSLHTIERKEVELQNRYSTIAVLLDNTSESTGIDKPLLVNIARRMAVTMQDTEWYEVLETVDSFFRVKAYLEKGEDF